MLRVDRCARAIGRRDHRLDLCRGVLGRDQVVLEGGEAVAHQLHGIAADGRDVAAVGEVHRFHDALDHAPAVIGVEDVEARPQTGDLGLDAELSCAEPVERADPGGCCTLAERSANARGHLASRFVREGHGQDSRRIHPADRDAVRDRRRQGSCLAGAGPGEHQDRPMARRGVGLCCGQAAEIGRTHPAFPSLRRRCSACSCSRKRRSATRGGQGSQGCKPGSGGSGSASSGSRVMPSSWRSSWRRQPAT